MATSRDERHRFGQHYTPSEVGRLLAAFAVRAGKDLVLDPGCGDGRLLAEALEAKLKMREAADRNIASGEVFGLDRSPEAAAVARATGCGVAAADFFDVSPGRRLDALQLPDAFDAIVGNPPYIRQEVMGAHDKRRILRRLAINRLESPETFWPEWSRRSDIYVYFFGHAIRFLKRGGRLVFITAGSWLDVDYGAALREFLIRNFKVIALIESAVESFFSDASINTVITVLDREDSAEDRLTNEVRFVRLTSPLGRIAGVDSRRSEDFSLSGLAREIESVESSATLDHYESRLVSQAELDCECRSPGGKRGAGWGRFLRARQVFFAIAERGRPLRPLGEVARVRFGVKTGANDFFYLREVRSKAGALRPLEDVARIRRGLTTGANEFFYLKKRERGEVTTLVQDRSGTVHEIESRFLRPVVFSLKEIESILFRGGDENRLVFVCNQPPAELGGTKALEYIQRGEGLGYHERPTCAGREPWYSVGRGMRPAPLLFPSKVGERWLVALNLARFQEDKKLYGIFPGDESRTEVLAALLNSTWARYYAEITCRQMTGAQAIADIDVAVAGRILLPDAESLDPALAKDLVHALHSLGARPVRAMRHEVEMDDRRALDEAVLRVLGFSGSEVRTTLEQLYEATVELVDRRLRKARSRAVAS